MFIYPTSSFFTIIWRGKSSCSEADSGDGSDYCGGGGESKGRVKHIVIRLGLKLVSQHFKHIRIAHSSEDVLVGCLLILDLKVVDFVAAELSHEFLRLLWWAKFVFEGLNHPDWDCSLSKTRREKGRLLVVGAKVFNELLEAISTVGNLAKLHSRLGRESREIIHHSDVVTGLFAAFC